jgi:multisubunit Na+/H+ antiporter MnhF subunit
MGLRDVSKFEIGLEKGVSIFKNLAELMALNVAFSGAATIVARSGKATPAAAYLVIFALLSYISTIAYCTSLALKVLDHDLRIALRSKSSTAIVIFSSFVFSQILIYATYSVVEGFILSLSSSDGCK